MLLTVRKISPTQHYFFCKYLAGLCSGHTSRVCCQSLQVFTGVFGYEIQLVSAVEVYYATTYPSGQSQERTRIEYAIRKYTKNLLEMFRVMVG